jgi:hypothetical protein
LANRPYEHSGGERRDSSLCRAMLASAAACRLPIETPMLLVTTANPERLKAMACVRQAALVAVGVRGQPDAVVAG